MITVWILTREINEHDQAGEYFVEVFRDRPEHWQLSSLGVPTNRLRHVLNGGGRVTRMKNGHPNMDNEWFFLKEHTV